MKQDSGYRRLTKAVTLAAATVSRVPVGRGGQSSFHLVMTRALAALSPREREMIQLVDIGRLTEREAAAKLGITLGTAKSYRHSARMRLRDDPALSKLRDVA